MQLSLSELIQCLQEETPEYCGRAILHNPQLPKNVE